MDGLTTAMQYSRQTSSIPRIAVPSHSDDHLNSRTLHDGAHHPNAGDIVNLHPGTQVPSVGQDKCLEVSYSRNANLNSRHCVSIYE